MKAFDTDILTEILHGNPAYATRVEQLPIDEQSSPIIAIEELLRGRLNAIRQAEAGKSRISIDRAYRLLEETIDAIRELKLLSFTDRSEQLVREWRKARIRGSTHDLRMAATCIAHSATLVTRNRRDFEDIPGLTVEFWE